MLTVAEVKKSFASGCLSKVRAFPFAVVIDKVKGVSYAGELAAKVIASPAAVDEVKPN